MAEHFIIVSNGTWPQKEENPENDIFYSCLDLHQYIKKDYMVEFLTLFFQIQNTCSMQLEIITLSGISQKKKDKFRIISLTGGS